MKERPILFSGPMVRALLDCRKTQTRRVVKPEPWAVMPHKAGDQPWAYGFKFYPGSTTNGDSFRMKCPFGYVGDRLWVRETWCNYPMAGNDGAPGLIYRATSDVIPKGYWKPSIFMPRWASRITLEITDVRVERLNDISEADAVREGVQCAGVPASLTNRGAFAKLWESINGDGSWKQNPWVWVIDIKRIESNG